MHDDTVSLMTNDQQSVIRFLSTPQSYDDHPATVEMIETHGARVFLAGHRAIKIKRAIRYPYMDFSTLEKRRCALTNEFKINHPFAADIYTGVIPITRERDGELAFDGAGEPIEWALIMTRFDQTQLLSAIAARGDLDPALAERVAGAVAAYHDAAVAAPSSDGTTRLADTITNLATSGLTGAFMNAPQRIKSWETRARDHLTAHRTILDARAAAGDVRIVHGDLHLANIVVINGEPTLFDAIEFDDKLRTVDRLYDLAFLLMDLDLKACPPPANVIFNSYLDHLGNETDLDALALLPVFLSLRAAIRAMVANQRAALATPEARQMTRRKSHTYFERAEAYLSPSQPRLIAVGGFSGTGKTTLARALAPDIAPCPGAVILRSDVERKRLFGVSQTTRLPPASYTREASDAVYAILFEKARRTLAAGHSVILDAVFSKEAERAQARQAATANAAPFSGLWLKAPPETMRSRVSKRFGDASDATAAVVDAQLAATPDIITWPHVTAAGAPALTLTEARAKLRLRPSNRPDR